MLLLLQSVTDQAQAALAQRLGDLGVVAPVTNGPVLVDLVAACHRFQPMRWAALVLVGLLATRLLYRLLLAPLPTDAHAFSRLRWTNGFRLVRLVLLVPSVYLLFHLERLGASGAVLARCPFVGAPATSTLVLPHDPRGP